MMSVYVRNDVTTLRRRIVYDQYNTRSLLEVLRGSIACSSAALSPGITLRTPWSNCYRTAIFETIFLSRPRRAQCSLVQAYSDSSNGHGCSSVEWGNPLQHMVWADIQGIISAGIMIRHEQKPGGCYLL